MTITDTRVIPTAPTSADSGPDVIDFAATDGFGDPRYWDGDCPRCPGAYLLDTAGRLPDHKVAGGRLDRPHCTGSGEPGHNPRRAHLCYVEGVRYL
jgi:hypothetical protein